MENYCHRNAYHTSPQEGEHNVRNVIYGAQESPLSTNMAYNSVNTSPTGERGDNEGEEGENTYEVVADTAENVEFGDNVAYGTIPSPSPTAAAAGTREGGYSKLLESTSVRIETPPEGYSMLHPSPRRVGGAGAGPREGDEEEEGEERKYETPENMAPDKYSHLEYN